MSDRVDWVEKFVQLGAAATSPDASESGFGGSAGTAAAGSTSAGSHAAGSSLGGDTPRSASSSLADLLELQQQPLPQRPAEQQLPQPPGPSPTPQQQLHLPPGHPLPRQLSAGGLEVPESPTVGSTRMPLHVGVLQYTPSLEPFPLLADPSSYEPNTLDNLYEDEVGARACWGPPAQHACWALPRQLLPGRHCC
jgi:type II pantothenate kinase